MVKVSVIVPVYNAEKFLKRCIDSILNQTFNNIELICVDDGSTDDSINILESYRRKDSRIKIIKQTNMFAGVARNNGLKHAKGEYIIFLDADDFFELTMIEELVYKADRTQCEVCICDGDYYISDKNVFDKNKHVIFKNNIPNKEVFSYVDIPNLIYQISFPAPWNKFYRKDFLIKNQLRFEETKRANDLRFYGQSMVLAKKITVLNRQLIHYRVGHSNHLQSNYGANKITEKESLKQVELFLKEYNLYSIVEKSFLTFAVSNNFFLLKKYKKYRAYKIAFDLIYYNPILEYDMSCELLAENMLYIKMCRYKKIGSVASYIYNFMHSVIKGELWI